MKITKIKIKNLFGISETELDGQSVELSGANGVGKSSVIDAIKYALTNSSDKKIICKAGATEGEILIETDSGLSLTRKKRSGMADYKSVKQDGHAVDGPESLLRSIFTPLQLDPISFINLSEKEQNEAILGLIDYPWDLNWIQTMFGEIPKGVKYDQNIMNVLQEIGSDKGYYFQQRQDINRDERNQRAFMADIAKDIPANYNADYWANFDISQTYAKIDAIEANNNQIQAAKNIIDTYNEKIQAAKNEKDLKIQQLQQDSQVQIAKIESEINTLQEMIRAKQYQITTVQTQMDHDAQMIDADYNVQISGLSALYNSNKDKANEVPTDTETMKTEAKYEQSMIKILNDYTRMKNLQESVKKLAIQSKALTDKIELARTLPAKILARSKMPIHNLSIVDGIPMIDYGNGPLPISNLSEGQKLMLCVDIALARPNNLQIILLDGIEKLSTANQQLIYTKCKAAGMQFIATKTTDSDDMEVIYL